jgi:hypothetical protein
VFSDGRPAQLVQLPTYKPAGDEYVRFDQARLGLAQWAKLKFHAIPSGGFNHATGCSICAHTKSGVPMVTKCGHTFHSSCLNEWKEACAKSEGKIIDPKTGKAEGMTYACPNCKEML